VLVRLDSIVAVSFSRSAIDGEDDAPAEQDSEARAHWGAARQPIEAGPVGG
jgi:hypothetical protein